MKPFFSIIIPTLNEEKCLPQILKCLAKQSYDNFEVLVVDGMSEDKTVENAEALRVRFEKKDISFSIHEVSKRSVSFQRNFGTDIAKGKYLVFFDADVKIKEDFLKKIHTHIEEKGTLLMTTWLTADDDEFINELFMLVANYGIDLARYTNKPYLPGFNIIVERNSFFAIGAFDEKIKLGEDLEFARQAHKKGLKLKFLYEPKLQASLRRFRSEGRFTVWKDSVKSLTRTIVKGPIKDNNYVYEMGGEYHKKHKPQSFLDYVKNKLNQTIG